MKITIKTTPDSLSLELSKIESEELRKNIDLMKLAIHSHPSFNPEASSLELEAHSVDEFEEALEEVFESIDQVIDKAEKS